MFDLSAVEVETGDHDAYTFECVCTTDDAPVVYEGDQCETATLDGAEVCFNGGSIT